MKIAIIELALEEWPQHTAKAGHEAVLIERDNNSVV